VVLVLVAIALGALSRSSLFTIEHVTLEGLERLSEEHVRTLADVPEDATLLRFPGGEVADRVESDPWIKEAVVSRDFPDTMRIRVVEREAAALVDLGVEYLAVDGEGFIIERRSLEETSSLIVIRDVDGLDPSIGRQTSSESLLNALEVLAGLSSDLRAETRALSAPTIDETALITTEGVEVLFGGATDVSQKDTVILSILEEQGETVVFIDVRTVDRPVWRGLGD
jgi:cell division protein FtsQ